MAVCVEDCLQSYHIEKYKKLYQEIVPTVYSFVDCCKANHNLGNFVLFVDEARPPLWSSGQSSWLQIRRPGFDSRHYQGKKVVGLELGPLSLVSTTEELLDRKVAAPV
jgi:hypothetical protein